MVRPSAAALVVLLPLIAGCKLSEPVPAPPSAPFLVVHGILNTRETRQFVTVERTRGDSAGSGALGGAGVSGATVRLTHLNPVNCTNPTVQLVSPPVSQAGVPNGGIYLTRDLCPLHPGDQVALRIETPDGKVVTGTTRIPGASDILVRAGVSSVGFPPGMVVMDRTRDSILIDLKPLFAPAIEVEAFRNDVGGFLTFRLSADSTGMRIAGSLVNPFDGDGRTVFRAGAYYLLTVAAIDPNYYDFVRSGADPFTGRGFINHLSGAVGVFGSVAPYTYDLKVTAPQTDPREGVYHITGQLSGVTVDITWDLYRDGLSYHGDGFSGFVDGTWVDGPILTSANVGFDVDAPSTPLPAGAANPNFAGQFYGPPTDSLFPGQVGNQYTLVGQRASQGQPFDLVVAYSRNGQDATGTVTAVQISGPP